MSDHPYKPLPDSAFWRRAVAAVPPAAVNPALPAAFRLTQSQRVATAGSCFAQHIGDMLARTGFNFLITEPAHPVLDPGLAAAAGYGRFTARYGNVYTARQLWQLWQRAYGEFVPQEPYWRADEAWLDPFRPTIQPGGFLSAAELAADQAQHLAAVRAAFETLDVFVFTLGLTEAWISRTDGAVFPVCPGVAGGAFSDAAYRFHRFEADEVVADMTSFITALRRRNPAARVILTVSPVPLAATAAGEHVMVATMEAKAALRVAAGRLARALPDVAYFPAFEIIMSGAFSTGSYFEPDRRSVSGAGVAHVMRAFAASFAGIELPPPTPLSPAADVATARLAELMAVHCDELLLDER
jgi:hypothetical protein